MTPGYQIEWDEVQALVQCGLRELGHAQYRAVTFPDGTALREFLERVRPLLSFASDPLARRATNVAISSRGLHKLGAAMKVPWLAGRSTLDSFSYEFHRDLGHPRTASVLGQENLKGWAWGGPDEPVDLFLIDLHDGERTKALEELIDGSGAMTLLNQAARYQDVEPFGFKDPISGPVFEGESKQAVTQLDLPAGEFLLGYPNASGELPLSPSVDFNAPHASSLAPLHDGQGLRRDLGRNGSYLVVQQLAQHLQAFEALRAHHGSDVDKLVGREQDGEPLTPQDDDLYRDLNDFGYRARDADGRHCPIGAHVRRANPRDSLLESGEHSIRSVRQHSILRRGRIYENDDETGLMFLAFNAQIHRQFEFIQQQWIRNTRFGGLHGERDPLLGGAGKFTVDASVVPRQIDVPKLVTVRGGGYFFLPSRRALEFLATSE